MTNKVLKNLKLGLAGLVLAVGLNGCDNSRETTNSYVPKNDAKENFEESKEIDRLFKQEKVIINDPFNKYEEAIFSQRFSKKVYSENLCINLNDKIYYVTKKNEEEGIKDLIKISQDYEEGWLYLPEKQIWYEIGICSGSESASLSRLRIIKTLEKNKDVKELIFYHNHSGEGFARPSIWDKHSLVLLNLIFPDYKIIGKIITKDSIVDYSLNSKGKEEVLKNENDAFLFEYFDIKCTSVDLLKHNKK